MTRAIRWVATAAGLRSLWLACGLVLALAPACGDSPSASAAALPDAGPEFTLESDDKLLQLQAYSAPFQPPTRGLSTVTLDITNAKTGAPQDGLVLDAVPWMPAHGHGTSVTTAVEAKAGGVYVVSRVNMFMGGKWDLRLGFSGAVTDRATLHFSIP
ncbi:MAG TPA: FixH family protein [Polyangiales bacterium]